jgi:hypothetical protein
MGKKPWDKRKSLLKKKEIIQLQGANEFKLFDLYSDHPSTEYIYWNYEFGSAFPHWRFIEKDVTPQVVAAYDSEEWLKDDFVLNRLGGHAIIKLAHLFELMDKQSVGQIGFLLADGSPNIAHVLDDDGNMFSLQIMWRFHHLLAEKPPEKQKWWQIFAFSDYWYPHLWPAPCRFLAYDHN